MDVAPAQIRNRNSVKDSSERGYSGRLAHSLGAVGRVVCEPVTIF